MQLCCGIGGERIRWVGGVIIGKVCVEGSGACREVVSVGGSCA